MSTAPWNARAIDDTLASALTCVTRLEAVHPTLGVRALELVSAQLSYDEARTPYVALSGAIAATPDALEVLDERAAVRLRVTLGYVYPGGEEDAHVVAELLLEDATVRRGGTPSIQVNAYSDEILMGDAPWTVPGPWTAATTFGTAYRQLIAAIAGQPAADAATVDPALEHATFLPADETLTVHADDNLRQLMRDLADRVSGRAYHDGLTGWRADLAAVDTGSVAAITTGRRGLIRSTEATRDRGAWGNAVVIVYRWRDATDTEHEIVGRAQRLTGPLGVETVGRKTLPPIVRTTPTTQAAADNAAAALLGRAITRRRVVAPEVARALWWIRAAQTVTVSTPDDLPHSVIVSSVTFDLPAATMQLRTRTPEEA
ncbi:hypothetical protein [Microbacterium rhizophilus]|uniref:hypothetical protein n=1 Tax=Microbacterium rhizophilus TaxID=3138934 RepID=UPI0031F16D54